MSGLRRTVLVTVIVASGAVAFDLGGSTGLLSAGMSRVFAEDAKPAALPEGIRGFQGMMTGTIVKKGTDEFLLKVETIDRTWRGNKAKNPESVVGKTLPVALWKESRLYERHRETLATLKPGDRVSVEPFHRGGNHLSVVEALKKID